MTIGERIYYRRNELGISQSQLAKMLGYKDRSAISKLEKSTNVSIDRLDKIADMLQCSRHYLLGDEKESSAPTFKPEHIKLITLYEKLSDEKKEALFTLLETM